MLHIHLKRSLQVTEYRDYSIFIALAPLVLILPPIMKKVDIVEY